MSEAATGEREEALMIALMIVNAGAAQVLVPLAQQVGLDLACAARAHPDAGPWQSNAPGSARVH